MDARYEEIFYKTFTENRPEIGRLLEQNMHYNFLTNVFRKLGSIDNNCVKNMLLGLIGYECNKQMALYTIPTIEFMDVVYSLQIILDKYSVIEMYSGLGLFSHLYSKYTEEKIKLEYPKTEIFTYDGDRCIETHSTSYYHDVEKTSFEQFIIDKDPLEGNICIAIMPDYNIHKSLRMFIEVCKPGCLVIVVNKDDKNLILENIPSEQYHVLCLDTKIISYLDYYLEECKDYSHTCTIIVSPINITESVIRMVSHEILMSPEDIIVNDTLDENEYIFNDCVMNHLFPKWMLQMSLEDKAKVLQSVYRLLWQHPGQIEKQFYAFINSNISNLEEFWDYINWKPRPPIFCTKEKYIEYKKIYLHIINNEPLTDLIKCGIIPSWINDVKSALLYTYLEYESKNKLWKLNEEAFKRIMTEYDELFN